MPQETLRYISETGLSGGFDLDVFTSTFKAAGDSTEGDIIGELGGLLGNPKATAYVSDVGKKLVSGSNRKGDFRFDVLKNDDVNAFALPNGSVYTTRGLLRLLRTEAQLANVLGHEVGHVDRDHGTKQLVADFGADAAAWITKGLMSIFGADKEARKKTKEMVGSLISNGYSQNLENEADEIGQKFAYMAGWDPRGMIDVMALFASFEKGPKPEGLEAYTRSHPWAADRLALAQERAATVFTKKGDSGTDRYKAFLADAFGVSPKEAALTPMQAATSGAFMMGSGAVMEYLVPALAIGGVAAAVLMAVYLYTRR